jgi:hypothetical protein
MKFLIPKSYRVKHKMLKFLSKERMKDGGLNPVEKYRFSIKEVAKAINEKYEDLYDISDYLFYKNLVVFEKNEKEITNPFCWVSDEGIELYSSFELINKGKELNTNLFNSITSGIFTIIIGIIAIISIVMNYQDSKIYNEKVSTMHKELETMKTNQLISTKEMLDLKNSFQQSEYYQTNIQKNGKN